MASPHVAGTVALYFESHPNATPAEAAAALTNEATSGVMTEIGASSPNLMLFTDQLAPTAGEATISGSVILSNGRALKNTRVVLQDAAATEFRVATTNEFGQYTFENVQVGDFYVLSIENTRYHFPNSPLAFTLIDEMTSVAFVGTPRRK